MLDRICANYFVVNKEEISSLKDHDEVYELMFCYPISANFELSAFLNLANLHFNFVESELLKKTVFTLNDDSIIYECNADFVSKLSLLSEEETEDLAYKWRESYWSPNNLMEGLGIWSHLFSLRFVCKTAIEENKSLFVVKDHVESKLEK